MAGHDNARVRQLMLKAKPATVLLRRRLVIALTFPACHVLHRVRCVEVIAPSKPASNYSVEPRNLPVARVGSQRGVSGKDRMLHTIDDQSRWASLVKLWTC